MSRHALAVALVFGGGGTADLAKPACIQRGMGDNVAPAAQDGMARLRLVALSTVMTAAAAAVVLAVAAVAAAVVAAVAAVSCALLHAAAMALIAPGAVMTSRQQLSTGARTAVAPFNPDGGNVLTGPLCGTSLSTDCFPFHAALHSVPDGCGEALRSVVMQPDALHN